MKRVYSICFFIVTILFAACSVSGGDIPSSEDASQSESISPRSSSVSTKSEAVLESSESISTGNNSISIAYLEPSYAFDINEPTLLVGDADYVFAARVDELIDTVYKNPVMVDSEDGYVEVADPYTNYSVTVISNIKGELITGEAIPIQKAGGITADGSKYILYEDDFLPEVGEIYLFYAYAGEDGSLLISGANSTKEVVMSDYTDSDANSALEKAIQNTDEYEEVMSALENQQDPTGRKRYVSVYETRTKDINSQSSKMITETQESSEVSSSTSAETSKQSPKIHTIHLEEGTPGPPFEQAYITDEADIQYIYEALQNMEPAKYYEQLIGGYSVMLTFYDSNEKKCKYLITNTDRGGKEGYVLAYNTDILENPVNIENYDRETKYYKWHNLQSDIWAVIQKYIDCPFEYIDGEFVKKP